MNEIEGVKKTIIDVAKKIAQEDGISTVSIRSVATKCGIAVGTVYNHFPSKGDLIAQIISDFWENTFKGVDFDTLNQLPPVSALGLFYIQLLNSLSSFKVNWLEQLSMLGVFDKRTGREKEKEVFAKISTFIEKIIIKSNVVTLEYNEAERKRLSIFIFDNMLAMLRRGEDDFSFAERVLTKILH